MLAAPCVIEAADFDEALGQLPNTDAVFAVLAGDQSAYVAKTSMLRRRLNRVLRPAQAGTRGLNLRPVATRVEYWLSGSRFESGLIHYALLRERSPDNYLEQLKLRMPVYVRLLLGNEFPRTQVTARLGRAPALNYGPFRSRSSAEQFETEMLDLFQLRRCQEDLAPRPEHPGCIYGEMNMCLRPCQQAVGTEEYRSEANRVAAFLGDSGKALLHTIEAARDQLSAEMDFEEAARQHKRLERAQQALSWGDNVACDIDQLHGVAVTASNRADAVRLWFLHQGFWQTPRDFFVTSDVSLDRRLREAVGGLTPATLSPRERQEHLALLARWIHSTWRDGEWIRFEGPGGAPYRRLARAVSRVHAAATSGKAS